MNCLQKGYLGKGPLAIKIEVLFYTTKVLDRITTVVDVRCNELEGSYSVLARVLVFGLGATPSEIRDIR